MQLLLLTQLMFLSAIISLLLSLYTWKHRKYHAILNLFSCRRRLLSGRSAMV